MWNFFKKRKEKNESTFTEIPLAVLARWYFYDAGLDDPNKLASLVGMVPTSSDGERLEEEESDTRIMRVRPLIPFIETIADINARAITTLQFDHFLKSNNLDETQLEEEREQIEEMYCQVGYSALLSAFASGLELGIISTDAIKGDII